MQDISVADDVVGAGGAYERDAHVFGDQRLKELAPGPAARAGILVGEVEDLHAVLAVQPGDLGSQPARVAVAPPGPEAALAAVVAQVRAAPGELHDDGALAAPVAVARVIYQFPTDAVSIEVADDWGWRGGERRAADAEGEARDGAEVAAGLHRGQEATRRFLALTAHDDVHVGFVAQDFAPVIGGMNAAVDDADGWQSPPHGGRYLGDDAVP